MYKTRAQVFPFVVDTLWTISKNVSSSQNDLGIPGIVGNAQVAALFGTSCCDSKLSESSKSRLRSQANNKNN